MVKLDKGIHCMSMKWYVENLKEKVSICDADIANYNAVELEKVIEDIISNITIGNVAVTDEYVVVEGRKRIYAINSFIDGEIKFSNKYYTELSEEELDSFNNYELRIFVG